jgi:hypothetical protein
MEGGWDINIWVIGDKIVLNEVEGICEIECQLN